MTPWLELPDATFYVGNALDVLATLPPSSVHSVVTSPPYLGLRKYEGVEPTIWDDPGDCVGHDFDGWTESHDIREEAISGKSRTTARYYLDPSRKFDGNHQKHSGSAVCSLCGAMLCCLGLEPDVASFIRHLVAVFAAVKKVLRDDGVLFIDIGDSYSTRSVMRDEGGRDTIKALEGEAMPSWAEYAAKGSTRYGYRTAIPEKNLLLVPQRLTIALQDDGWIIRSVFPWLKRNCLPGSQRDRPTTAHETWIMAVKKPRYFFDLEAIRRESEGTWNDAGFRNGSGVYLNGNAFSNDGSITDDRQAAAKLNPGGRAYRTTDAHFDSLDDLITTTRADLAHLERCRDTGGVLCGDEAPLALDVCPQASSLAHYASFGEKVIRDLVLASTPERVCSECGAPWERVTEDSEWYKAVKAKAGQLRSNDLLSLRATRGRGNRSVDAERATTGHRPTCTHSTPTIPGTILDPFSGTATVQSVARQLGRRSIYIDASETYAAMAANRLAAVTPSLLTITEHVEAPTQLSLTEVP